jgi:hypothetical protein|tara:strand:- start:4301 stop:4900 length:600 start_codon:yes stop_codon:yes gene_type:complete
MADPVRDFLQAFSSEEKYFIPHPFLWKVSFQTSNAIKGQINAALNKAGEGWRARTFTDDYTKNGSILVAQDITIPGEQTAFAELGQENRGGFLPGYGVTQREGFLQRQLSINFIETDRDICHDFFTPWLIAIGIDGLINQQLKCGITLKQYNNQGHLRKGFEFDNAFPTNVEGGGTLNYGPGEFIIKTVTFGCKNYRQL